MDFSHCCEKEYLRCEDFEKKFLQLYSVKSISVIHSDGSCHTLEPIKVDFCPFCGFCPKKETILQKARRLSLTEPDYSIFK